MSNATKSAVIRSSFLLGVKAIAFIVTGSAVLMAALLDSIVDVIASLIAHILKPKSHHESHQIALIQAFWIVAGGIIVMVESLRSLHEPVEMATVGIAILVLTLVIDASIIRKLNKDKDPVVHGLVEDIKADVTNSIGGLTALTLIAIGAPMVVDKFIAIVISVFLIAKGARLFMDNMIEASEDHAAEHELKYEVEGGNEQYV
jgi:divalent metal cation (Fe/Co/Zn/Cd) transporter